MLEFIGRGHRTCDGVSRAQFPQGRQPGPRRPDAARLAAPARGAEQSASSPRKSVILIWQAGGPSHIDMYDLKPNAPAEIRGEFKPIETNVPGIQIGEHLPRQAQHHGQAGHRAFGVPHQRRPRHGLAVDADRLPADHRGQRQHLSLVRLRRGQDARRQRAGPAGLRQPAAACSASARRPTSAPRTTRSRRTAIPIRAASRCAT